MVFQNNQRIDRRHGFGEKIEKYNRRHGFGENTDCGNREVKMCGSRLGRLPCRSKLQQKMQVRPAGQAGYPISLVASLDTVPVKCCVPGVPLQK